MKLLARSLPLLLAAMLVGCGFHLRKGVALPEAMKRVHITVAGNFDLQRALERQLRVSGATIEDKPGVGIAELSVPVALFTTQTLSVSTASTVNEYAVHDQVQFQVIDGKGDVLVGRQIITMTREYSYDATNTVGTASQVQELQNGLNNDMVQAIMFRLRAATKRPDVLKKADPSAVPPDQEPINIP